MPTAALPLPIPHLAHNVPLGPQFASSPLRFILHIATGAFRRWILLALTLETANAACGILLPYALGRIITRVTSRQGDPASVLGELAWPLALFAALCLGELAAGRLAGITWWHLAPRQRQQVARALFGYVQRHSHRFLTEHFAGSLGHRIGEVSQGVNHVLSAAVSEFWPIGITIVVANALLLTASPWLALFTGAWSITFIAVSLLIARRVQPLAHAAASARSQTAGQIIDTVSNHATVRLFAGLGQELGRLDRRYGEELGTVMRANRAMERIRFFQFGAAALLKAGMVGLAVVLWSRGLIDVGSFVMAISLALLVIAEVRNLSRRFLDLFEHLGNVGSGIATLLGPHELSDDPRARPLVAARGHVAFTRVRFTYPGGSEVFGDLSLDIPAGQRVGLVGFSGSGKSTFVNLLLRLYDPQGGTIRIDGHELRALAQDSLRRQVGLIPQDPTLFHRSLRENIRYGRPDASDAEVEAAAARAHADTFIRAMPGGYDAQVGERGVKLSGGQRQRIALARVILKDAPVLVLDEATASLDSLTERAIQEALDEVMVGKTVIVIAHRLSTIAHLDRILVFAQGEVIEDGTHDALLARGGAYHALWTRQADGALPEEAGAAAALS
jgi:ATP-binding cassette subfamily B protein